MIRVLITDDSKVVRLLIRALIEQEPDIEVVGEAENGQQAVALTKSLKPDVITMDIRMPVMDGFEATQIIMMECPTPILVVSASVNSEDLMIAFNALEAGALGVIEKPPGLHGDDYDKVKRDLVNALKAYHEIKVIRHRSKKPGIPEVEPYKAGHDKLVSGEVLNEVVAIGASTGGPALLGDILRAMPINFPVPIVIVQHISEGFTNGLAMWLNDVSRLIVKVAEDGEILRPGAVYIAPYGTHMVVDRKDGLLATKLEKPSGHYTFCPAVDRLFESVAERCPGHGLGVLLTGMGSDGAKGLLAMSKANCFTIGQDEKSSVVYGMPKEAMAMGAVKIQLAGSDMAQGIRDHINDVQDSRLRGRQ